MLLILGFLCNIRMRQTDLKYHEKCAKSNVQFRYGIYVPGRCLSDSTVKHTHTHSSLSKTFTVLRTEVCDKNQDWWYNTTVNTTLLLTAQMRKAMQIDTHLFSSSSDRKTSSQFH